MFFHYLTCSFFVDFSTTPSAPESASVEKPIATSPADGEKTAAVVEGSSTAQVVEGVVAPEVVTTTTEVVAETTEVAATTTEVVAATTGTVATTTDVVATTTDVVATTSEMVVETAEAAMEASGHGGDVVHRAGKEIIEDVPPGTQGEVAAAESEDEEYFNFCPDFFGPASVVGTAAFRSRDRVPHPNDIPNRGRTFDNERLEKVWWDQVEKIDKLKFPPLVFSTFAQTTMDVSI